MSIIIPANSAAAGGGFNVANSCMFNTATESKMEITFGSAGTSLRKATFSSWLKRSNLTVDEELIFRVTADSGYFNIAFSDADTIKIKQSISSTVNLNFVSTQKFRDPSAWLHMLVVFDTTQSTEGNRVKIYINGTQVTSWSTSTYPDQNTDMLFGAANLNIIASAGGGNYFGGYLAEMCYCDGQSLTPTSFGEFDEDSGIWKPIDVSGLTFGTNGFYLDFEDSANLGNDANGGTDLTETNLAATNQSTDTCTNNFVTLNRLDTHASATLSQGNTGIATTAGGWYGGSGTMGITLGQSLYFEAKAISTARLYFGLSRIGQGVRGTALNNAAEGDANFDYMWRTTSANSVWYGGSDQSITIAATSANDICACRVNTDGQVIFYKNDAVVVTYSTTLVAGYTYFPILSVNAYGGGTESWLGNFGNPSYAITSSNTDPDGYGDFEFSTKSAYALNTKNLAEYG